VRGFIGAVLAVGLGAVGAFGVAAPAGAAPGGCADPGQDSRTASWAQQMMAPDRIWSLSRGDRITVAVLDSGVDANQPQLRGRVAAGYDATTGNGTGDTDCLGSGTHVAGVIAARQAPNVGFFGVAPKVTILPVRVVSQSTGGGAPVADPAVLAKAIAWAAGQHPDVLCVSVATYTASDAVHQAVLDALGKGIVVVAAVGDKGDTTAGDPLPYPAAYDPVIAVGAIGPDGSRWQNSGHGAYVDVVAPGQGVTTAEPGQGQSTVDGTGPAAGFVAGSVALLLAYERPARLSPGVVARRLAATATAAPIGPRSTSYGYGIVNPYRMVTEQVTDGQPDALPGLRPSTPAEAERTRAAAWSASARFALWLSGAVLVVTVVVLAAGAAIPRGRRRRWRLAFAGPLPDWPEPDEPAAPVPLFDEH
jgi:hypothetical protein